MTEKYTDYATRFRENSSQDGLRFTFSQAFSAIPAAIGHLIDTLFHLDGLFSKDSKSHLMGPFGFLLGIIPFLLGFVIGEIVQQILNIPMYIGFVLDKAIQGIFHLCRSRYRFDQTMIGGLDSKVLTIINGAYIALTQPTPNQMQGPPLDFS